MKGFHCANDLLTKMDVLMKQQIFAEPATSSLSIIKEGSRQGMAFINKALWKKKILIVTVECPAGVQTPHSNMELGV
jgi:hypothetical protein